MNSSNIRILACFTLKTYIIWSLELFSWVHFHYCIRVLGYTYNLDISVEIGLKD